MSSLSYVGRAATAATEVPSRLTANTYLSGFTPNQASVQAQVNALTTGPSATYASKTYVDSTTAGFTTVSYYQAQDALNLPLAAVGAVNTVAGTPTQLGTTGFYGAASLDSTGHIPAAQLPTLGAGYIQGPYGITASFAGSTGITPMKIADWNLGSVGLAFQPLVFMDVVVTGVMSKPIIEVRIANSTTSVGYSSMTLIAQGAGRAFWNDYGPISVQPSPATTGQTFSTLGPNYNVWVTAWLYDAYGQTVSLNNADIVNASLFLVRGSQ